MTELAEEVGIVVESFQYVLSVIQNCLYCIPPLKAELYNRIWSRGWCKYISKICCEERPLYWGPQTNNGVSIIIIIVVGLLKVLLLNKCSVYRRMLLQFNY